MFCKNCGKELEDNAVLCPHCGVSTGVTGQPSQVPPPDPFESAPAPEPVKKVKYCRNCGKEIDEQAVVCVHCGVPTGDPIQPAEVKPKKKVNGIAIAGLAVGVVGLFGGNYLFLVPGIVALILSVVGMATAKKHSLFGLAIAALAVSICSFFIWGIIWGISCAAICAAFSGGFDTTNPYLLIVLGIL